MSAQLQGSAELVARLADYRDHLPEALAAAMLEWGYLVLGKSQPLVPVRTGRLRASAFAEVTHEGSSLVLHVGYGTDYALVVHERLDLVHEHGQAKFLSQPLEEMLSQFGAYVASRVPEQLGRGGA